MQDERIFKLQERYNKLKESNKSNRIVKRKSSDRVRKTFYIGPSVEEKIDQAYFQTRLDLEKKIGKIDFCETLLEVGLDHIEEVHDTLKSKKRE